MGALACRVSVMNRVKGCLPERSNVASVLLRVALMYGSEVVEGIVMISQGSFVDGCYTEVAKD